LGLAQQCERLAKEREKTLREEIERLLKENAQFRSRLQAENGEPEPKLVQAPPAGRGAKGSEESAIVACSPAAAQLPTRPRGDVDEDHSSSMKVNDEGKEQKAAIDNSQIVLRQTSPTFGHVGSVPTTESNKGPFHLLPELLADAWTGEDVIDDHHGAYFERENLMTIMRQRCILHPASDIKLCWDVLGIPILAWDLITIPLQVFSLGASGVSVLDGAGWVTLLYWSFDMPVTFLSGYSDNDANLIMEPRKIAKQYIRGFFFLDLLIILGDWLSVVISFIGDDAPPWLGNLSVLRVLRISRFVRLLRLRKLKAKIQTIEDKIDNEWLLVILNLIAKTISIVVVNHYICCGWYYLGSNTQIETAPYRWLSSVPYPQYDSAQLGEQKMSDATWIYQYLTSLHWAIAQFTPGPQNIQPQNAFERAYVIFVLLFGMIVFSSFIASVTQARMQLTKLMSKCDREIWLLRKYCRQHTISMELTYKMKRYVDLVVIPNYSKLSQGDVTLINKLSLNLRQNLNTELFSQHVRLHPFFLKLQEVGHSAMVSVCNEACEMLSFARGDVVFYGGMKANRMFFCTGGALDYIPIHSHLYDELRVPKGHWCSEAVLWTKWTHQGQLQASIESGAVGVNGSKFRAALCPHGFVMGFVRAYGRAFCAALSNLWEHVDMPSDLHEKVAIGLDLSEMKTASFVWYGAHGIGSPKVGAPAARSQIASM